MTHPLVTQLWFARGEFVRCLMGVSAEDAVERMEPMNCLSWIVGHLASQEQYLWLESTQGRTLVPNLQERVGYGSSGCTPPWEEMWRNWREITEAADRYLETITVETVKTGFNRKDDLAHEDIGTSLFRNIYHYWFHLGEAHAIRQMLGHKQLPQFVGDLAGVRY